MFEILKDKKDPESIFSKWRLQEEKKALILSDIPYFFCFPGEQKLLSGSGAEFPVFFCETIIQAIERRIKNLSEADLTVQLNLIEAALGMGRKDLLPKANTFSKREEIRAEVRIEAAEKLADMIVQQMIRTDDGTVGWIQFSIAGYREKGQMILPTGMYLYNGLAGILLFFQSFIQQRAYEGYTYSPKYEEVCEQLAKQILAYTKNTAAEENLDSLPTGLLNGEGSLVLLYQLLYRSNQNSVWLDAMRKQCIVLSQGIERDTEYDLLSGNAGAVMVLLNAFEVTGDSSFLVEAIRAGDHLLSHACKEERGWCWKGSAVKKGLTGMAHGNAGIIMALFRLSKCSGKEEYLAAAREAMRYEDSFYSAEKNDWMDLRLPPESVWANEGTRAWCHGYGGLILSRLKVVENTDKPPLISPEVIKQYKKKYAAKVPHSSLCLCHGKAGDYALQLLTGRERGAQIELSELIGFVLDDHSCFEDRLSVQERRNYGLMSGLAGIGYAILANRMELEALFTGYLR